ncbi:hypothetical protein D0869_13777 [Hortaea werneckii]|uniref:EKC/KEOPS complex subunit BUD32 n=1 Tax=Hortaea werneckii TaxID=91943 RepID=A0A3M6W431_HORWE|nr:hypothetical protein D0869_13777 [Hortaea werneckii]RMY12401.1 hypothetical protein D0868_02607 [Hortaea werneckii]
MPDSTTLLATTTTPSPPSPHHHNLPSPFNHPPTDQTPLDLIAQGAESLLFRTTFLSPNQPAALKIRPRKTWRHPTLDKRLTRARILAEARVLVKLSGEGIAISSGPGKGGGKGGGGGKVKDAKAGDGKLRNAVPRVLGLDWEAGWLVTEWIRGPMVKSAIFEFTGRGRRGGGDGIEEGEREGIEKGVRELLARVGSVVGRLHAAGVVHGDLTTSNLMLRRDGEAGGDEGKGDAGAGTEEKEGQGHSSDGEGLEGKVVLIDFGLALQSAADEDRAVDLYVLERAFGSTHPREEYLFPEVITAYQRTMNELGGSVKGAKLGAGDVVVRRLEDVRMRGRKKSMIG